MNAHTLVFSTLLSISAALCLVAQSCLTLCDLVDSRLPGSSVHGDSPGKNTGVGCHALLQGIFSTQGSNLGLLHCRQSLYCLNHQGNQGNYGVLCLVTQLCPTLCDPVDCSLPGFSVHGDSPGKNTGVGYHALLQGIFSTQGSKPGLPHCRRILYHLSYEGNPRMLEWVAYPFSRRTSQPRKELNQGLLHCGPFFTS